MNNAISIILDHPTHPGNIGACARAMKNMGLTQLVLINPKRFPDKIATARASGATDILESARVVQNVQEAIENCQWLFGTSARDREFPWPQLTPKEAALQIFEKQINPQRIGIIFGTESAGLPNEILQMCDFHISIPCNLNYSSLNLAQAVQIISYELYQWGLESRAQNNHEPAFVKATSSQVQGLLNQFEEVAIALHFMDPAHPKKLMPRLRKLFAKSQLEVDEINILRGFLKLIQQRI